MVRPLTSRGRQAELQALRIDVSRVGAKIAGTLDVLQKLSELGGEGWHAIVPCCQGESKTIISADPGQGLSGAGFSTTTAQR
jgi:hypothetical protein